MNKNHLTLELFSDKLVKVKKNPSYEIPQSDSKDVSENANIPNHNN